MAIVGIILCVAAGIAIFVFWIMTLVKAFKANDTLWGVLSIFFPILAPIWCFINGHKGLGMKFVYAIIVYVVGAVLLVIGGAANIENMPVPQ